MRVTAQGYRGTNSGTIRLNAYFSPFRRTPPPDIRHVLPAAKIGNFLADRSERPVIFPPLPWTTYWSSSQPNRWPRHADESWSPTLDGLLRPQRVERSKVGRPVRAVSAY